MHSASLQASHMALGLFLSGRHTAWIEQSNGTPARFSPSETQSFIEQLLFTIGNSPVGRLFV